MVTSRNLLDERKHVTILFADIVGSTNLIQGMDTEDAAELLHLTVRQIKTAVSLYGGTVIREMGDGLFAAFGAPSALENHAIHAAHAALAMQRTVKELAEEISESASVAIRVGLNTGVVIAHRENDGSGKLYDLTGIPIHLASRLESMAEPGSIYLGESTHSLIRQEFACKSLGRKEIRGIDRLIEVFVLEHSIASTFARGTSNDKTTFIGRIRELEIISSHLHRLSIGQGSVIGLRGEAGIGKSRLIAQAAELATDQSVNWLICHGVSFGRTISHMPIIQLIRSAIGADDNDPDALVRARLSRTVKSLFPEEVDEVLPYLMMFLNLEFRGDYQEQVEFLDSELIGQHIHRSLRLFIQRLSWQNPLVLVCEDFYWFDESSAELIEHLLPLIQTESIMILLIGRGEPSSLDSRTCDKAAVQFGDRYSEISLCALNRSESASFIDSLLVRDRGLVRLREMISYKAEGNPLFIQESVRALIETGDLAYDQHTKKWKLIVNLEAINIPDTVQDVVFARIDRLGDEVKNVLLLASVVGRSFLYRLLREIHKETERLDENLDTLCQFEFIAESKIEPELEYIFRHAVIQEVTYDSILRNRRKRLHHEVGDALEIMAGEQVEKFSGVLAYHFGLAENWTKARRYLLIAGERADRLAADSEALHHFQLCIRAFGDRLEETLRDRLERKLGEAHYRRGEHEEAIRHFQNVLENRGAVKGHFNKNPRGPILRELLIQFYHRIRRKELVITDGNVSTDVPEEIEIYWMLAWMMFFKEPERLLLYSLAVLNRSENYPYPAGIALAGCTLVFTCNVLNFCRLAGHYARYVNNIANKISNPVVAATVQMITAWHNNYKGDWDLAFDQYSNAAMIAWQAGDLKSWGSSMWGRCMLSCHKGDFAVSIRLAEEMLSRGENSGDSVAVRWGHMSKAMTLARLGQFEKAEAEFKTALELAREAPDVQMLPQVIGEYIYCLVTQNRLEEAQTIADSLSVEIKTNDLRGHHIATVLNALAELSISKVESQTMGGRRTALRHSYVACKAATKAAKIYCGEKPRALRLMACNHWLRGRKKKAHQLWQFSLEVANDLGAKYETALTQISIGRYSEDNSTLNQGKALLRKLTSDIDVNS